jgi:hypothetical protein
MGAAGLPLARLGACHDAAPLSLLSDEDSRYLKDLAKAALASATRSESLFTAGFSFITPGGDYPALWIRDLSMAAGCGLISSSTLLKHFRVIASRQNGSDERRFGDGRAVIPPWAIPDHINFDGRPVFYPGTYSSGEDQGGEPFGVCPPFDDDFEFVHLAWLAWKRSGRIEFLNESPGAIPVIERLFRAMGRAPVDPETGFVLTEATRRAVGFGFCDTVCLTGSLLFPSLLRYRALGELVDLSTALGMPEKGRSLLAARERMKRSLASVFEKEGWLLAATEVGKQPDVWGTVFAVYLGVAQGPLRKRLLRTVVEAVRDGTITFKGAVRHVPSDRDFSKDSAWERTAGVAKNRYQNGAYWHVPTGWLAQVLWETDKPLARRVVQEMVEHFREEDFRKGGGAPWECLHPEGGYRQNRVYLASVTLPLEVLRASEGESSP